MRRAICLFLIFSFSCVVPQARSATPPGSEQTGSNNSDNTAAIVAVGAVGAIILGGLLWWRFHQSQDVVSGVIIRKPKGASPKMAFADFRPAASERHLSQRVRTLLYQALKDSQAFHLAAPTPEGLSTDSVLVLTAKVSALTSFSQADVSISRHGDILFSHTISWFDDRELKKQVVNLTNLITEQIK